VLATSLVSLNANTRIINDNLEGKTICSATLNDDFADNRILVTLRAEEFKSYSEDDFSEILDVSVTNLSLKSSQMEEYEKSQKSINYYNGHASRLVLSLELAEKSKENVLEAIKLLEKREDVLCAEPDYKMTFFSEPNPTPTYYDGQWALNNSNPNNSLLQMHNAWDVTKGKESVKVAIMDSGIQANHTDLMGKVDLDLSRNFTLPPPYIPSSLVDEDNHGTSVAGIVSAKGIGVIGVAPNVTLVSLQIANPDEGGSSENKTAFISTAILAFEYCEGKGFDVINLSAGYSGTPSTTLKDSIEACGSLVVCAAGNENNNNDESPVYPANYDLSNIISVGATTDDDARCSFSNYGSTSVNVYAPGYGISSTNNSGGYSFWLNGTSFAAPHVTGVAALMKSVNSNLTPNQIKSIIINHCDSITISTPIGNQNVKRLNAFKAVQGALPYTIGISGGNATITGLKQGMTLSGSIDIPTNIAENNNVYPVTAINTSAFANCSQISQISIPESVTSIGSNAFLNCTSLETVVIQREIGDITSLGSNAFLGCSSLETIESPTKRIFDYLYATNWESYSSYMHYIEPITDGLTITSVGEESEFYLFKTEDTIIDNLKYNFYHNCTNAVEITLMDESNTILVNDIVQKSIPILVLMDEETIYKIIIKTTESEFFQLNIDEVDESELELGIKYYETLNSYSYAYYKVENPQEDPTISYTINSTIVGARTNMWLYDSDANLITCDFGDFDHNGAKIDYDLAPDTTYTVLLYLTSYYYYDDYTIQFYETDEEVYHLDWGGISKEYFDPLTYDYVNYIVFSSCYDLVFDEATKTITFGRIECFWDVTFDGYPNCPEEYVIGMMIGITYDSFENTLAFFSMNGFYEYQAPLPYTYSYSATVTDVSITFSNTEWASFVTQGPR
jgi:subtilisin family serine protease